MIGYRQRLDDDLQARSNMITEASEEFLEKMSKQDVGSGIAEDLRLEKYTVDCCYDGPAACERLFVEPYDLVVLDLNLPGMDGLELLRHIRTEQPELRVLILSARSQLSDKVAGLDLGADD